MNLFLRLLWLRLWAGRRPACPLLGPCTTPFHVLPVDLDVLRHMNNGRYFSLLDLARVDLMLRSGLFDKLAQKGWYPVVARETIEFKTSLRLFQPFSVTTQVIGWGHKAILVQHRFVREGQLVASAAVWARMLRRGGGSVSPREVLDLAGYDGPELPMPAWALLLDEQAPAWAS